MPYLTSKQIARMKMSARESAFKSILSMERQHQGHRFVYVSDIKKLLRRERKSPLWRDDTSAG